MKKFNIRVYGILINNKHQLLVSDETRFDVKFTKFPGGGLEFGEGTVDCLKREFKEELNAEIEVKELFYLTDYFQESGFNPNDQLISIYYLVHCENQLDIQTQPSKIYSENQENHRWINISEVTENDFTFPIDKIVAKKITNEL